MPTLFLFCQKSKAFRQYAINRPQNQAKNAGINQAVLYRAEYFSAVRDCI